MQPLATAAGRVRRPSESLTRLRFGRVERAAMAVSAIYVLAAALIVGALSLPSAEAVSRGAHLGSLYDGFDTSLLAIGLERPPLLSALAMPFALLPGLRPDGLAVAVATALFGGAGVLSAYGLARWAGMTRAATTLYVAAFALNPLLVYAGAIGLPEALYATLVLAGVGQFMRWLDREAVGPVIGAGSAFGVAFFLRYNSVFIALAMATALWWVARNRGRSSERTDRAEATAMTFAVPVVFAMGLWAIISWFPHGNAFEFLTAASRLSEIGASDVEVVRRMDDLRLDLPAVAAWVGVWTALVAPLSVVAIIAVAVHAVVRRTRESAALALVLTSLIAPEAIALLTGSGQARVPHLFVMVVPAFAAFAYRERLIAGGARPGPYDSLRWRLQLGAAVALFAASIGSLAVLPLIPASDAPAPSLLQRIVDREPARHPEVEALAAWIDANALPGDVVIDPERSAAVMLATESLDRFRTPADEGDEATLYDPFGIARFVLVRRPIRGAGPGFIERAYPTLFADGAAWAALAFESGEYRVYSIVSSRE